jgi:transcription initiation factor IIE alpha subunit|tara:strand:- start:737 stop:1000 length:264 start_codon:yes stop_codon:yes gene_type:complete
MTNSNVESKSARVLAALVSGEELTGKQIASRFSVGNPRALVSSLRMNGYAIYANQRTDTKGRVKTKYRIGTAPRSVVAAGYRAMAAA